MAKILVSLSAVTPEMHKRMIRDYVESITRQCDTLVDLSKRVDERVGQHFDGIENRLKNMSADELLLEYTQLDQISSTLSTSLRMASKNADNVKHLSI